MTLEEQVKLYKELAKKIEAMEEQKRALGQSIMQQMQNKILKVPGFLVRFCSRLSIKLPLEEARLINAVKLEEVVDKDKIKALYNNGQTINGVSEIRYIQVVEQV
ncbi:MAG: hypothetical protein H0X51_04135 [Parachlamydiaceae bacterium]|nr:hypothetical protein [Parachlamydiaceae bacterium]